MWGALLLLVMAACGRIGFDPESGNGDVAPNGDGFCHSLVPMPTFCADFDESPLVGDGWTAVDDFATTAPVARGSDAVSPPGSLVSSIPASTSSVTSRLYWSTTNLPTSVHLELDMKVCPLAVTTGYVEPIAFIQVITYGIELQIDNGGPYINLHEKIGANATHDRADLTGPITPDVWHHVTLDVALDAAAGSVRLAIDAAGPTAFVGNVRTVSETMTFLRLYLGNYASGDTPACTTSYDNVALTLL